jgi:hypothetical protein
MKHSYKVKKKMMGGTTPPKKMPGGGKAEAPMYAMGGKTYADMGAMIKAEAGALIEGLAKNPKTFKQMEEVVGKKNK